MTDRCGLWLSHVWGPLQKAPQSAPAKRRTPLREIISDTDGSDGEKSQGSNSVTIEGTGDEMSDDTSDEEY